MTCMRCIAAERDPRRDEFGVGCISCDARALALVAVSASRETLGKVFGERREEGLRLVRQWAAKIRKTMAGRVPV